MPALWEAGANPALPRNCKRGQWRFVHWELVSWNALRGTFKKLLGRTPQSAGLISSPYSQARRRARTITNQPFRVQRSMVCVTSVTVFLVLLFSATALATDLKVKVVDPQSAAVAGAQVSLSSKCSETAWQVTTSSAEGIATFAGLRATDSPSPTCSLHIQVLAPGFAAESVDVPSGPEITVNLRLATASETVVVSATRTPVPGEAAGADVDTLSGAQLTTMQPMVANDAMRFLPGAVVNTAGQRGGLSSLFVRGGESNYNKVIVDGVAVNEPGGTFDFGTLSLESGPPGVRSRRADHALRFGCHDQRDPGLDAHGEHADSRVPRRRRWR